MADCLEPDMEPTEGAYNSAFCQASGWHYQSSRPSMKQAVVLVGAKVPHDSRLSASDYERAQSVVEPKQAARIFLSSKPRLVKACAPDKSGLSDAQLSAVLSKGEHMPQIHAGRSSQWHQASQPADALACLCVSERKPFKRSMQTLHHDGAGNLRQESFRGSEIGSLTQLKVCKTPGGTRSISEESWGRPITPDLQPGPGPLKFR